MLLNFKLKEYPLPFSEALQGSPTITIPGIVTDTELVGPKGGLNSGFMIPQYTTAALVTENKSLCFPAELIQQLFQELT